jgi:hypothetical protein
MEWIIENYRPAFVGVALSDVHRRGLGELIQLFGNWSIKNFMSRNFYWSPDLFTDFWCYI